MILNSTLFTVDIPGILSLRNDTELDRETTSGFTLQVNLGTDFAALAHFYFIPLNPFLYLHQMVKMVIESTKIPFFFLTLAGMGS